MANSIEYRAEAIANVSAPKFGNVVLIPSISAKVYAGFALVCTIAIVIFFGIGEFSRKTRVAGSLVLDQGVAKLGAPQAGIVAQLFVKEGQHVRKGDRIALIVSDKLENTSGNSAEQSSEQLSAKSRLLDSDLAQQKVIAKEQISNLNRRLEALRDEKRQLGLEKETQVKRFELAREETDRYRDLKDKKFISPSQLQQKEAELLDQQAKLQSIERAVLSLRRDIGEVKAAKSEIPLKLESSLRQLAVNQVTLLQDKTEIQNRRENIVSATQDGVITGLTVREGAYLAAGSILVSTVPEHSKLEAHLLIPGNAIGFVRPGQIVYLRYAAYPYQKFGHQTGKVTDVSKTALKPSEAGALTGGVPASLANSSESVYRVTVALDSQTIVAYGENRPLMSGLQLEADIEQERRKIYEWILDPLFTISGKLL